MIIRHFRLSSELSGAIAKRLLHAKNQLSDPDSFFNQFVTDIYKKYKNKCNNAKCTKQDIRIAKDTMVDT